jgi:hypothetical protein
MNDAIHEHIHQRQGPTNLGYQMFMASSIIIVALVFSVVLFHMFSPAGATLLLFTTYVTPLFYRYFRV